MSTKEERNSVIAWYGSGPPSDMWCSSCDKSLMTQQVMFAWIGHDVHAHLVVMSSCCHAAIVDRPEAHLGHVRNEADAARA